VSANAEPPVDRFTWNWSMELRGTMKNRKILAAIHSATHDFTIHPKAFVFFDRKTGTRRFEVKANTDGSLPVNHVASLLAVQCVMRGRRPQDFGGAVAAGEDLLSGLGALTEKLIQDCQMFQSPVQLTRREKEVLHEVLQVFSNKEIAEKVHISVRTVKFHVSALLTKFGVASRMDLMRKTADLFPGEKNSTEATIPQRAADPKFRRSQRGGSAGDGPVNPTGLERRSRS
jgi:DNA-binding CsgD family transcriptional regulator